MINHSCGKIKWYFHFIRMRIARTRLYFRNTSTSDVECGRVYMLDLVSNAIENYIWRRTKKKNEFVTFYLMRARVIMAFKQDFSVRIE